MPEQIISASGTQFGLVINPDGSVNTKISEGAAGGTFKFNNDIIITSGITNIITPSSGKKLYLKGFSASVTTANKFTLMFSGGEIINTFDLPDTATVAMNMIGMEPSGGVNQPISVETTTTGSLYVSIFVKEN